MANRSTPTSKAPGGAPTTVPLTPELVRAVAERVYALLQRDLALERERRPRRSGQGRRPYGEG